MTKLISALSFFILSCQSASTPTSSDAPVVKSSRGKTDDSALHGKQISSGLGENSQPVFSSNGQLLFFVSRKRPDHLRAQIYELNIETGRERRLTYQNGDAFSPAFVASASRIFYASNTDRLKEEASYLDNLKNIYSPKVTAAATPQPAPDLFDYYSSGLDSRGIQRIGASTLRAKSRAQVSIAASADGRRLAIVGDGLWITALNGFEARKVAATDVSRARFSADGKRVVWSETTPTGARLMVRATAGSSAATVLIETAGADDIMPSWNPKNADEIIFSSDRGSAPLKKAQFDLYALEIESKCLKRLTDTPTADETDPVFTPDAANLVYASNSSGSAQIYMAEAKSAAACLPLTP